MLKITFKIRERRNEMKRSMKKGLAMLLSAAMLASSGGYQD